MLYIYNNVVGRVKTNYPLNRYLLGMTMGRVRDGFRSG